MDFTNRGAQNAPQARASNHGEHASPAGGSRRKGQWKESPLWLRVVWIVLLFSATIVIAAMVTLFYLGTSKENDLVNKDKNQAVFLTNGQVYFGKVNSVNSKYMDLRGIFYLNVSQQVQPEQNGEQQQAQNISLVKLGCELHGPEDQMVINRDQISFWENLKEDGDVSEAITDWVEANPEGQNCEPAANNNSDSDAERSEEEQQP